MHMSTHMYMHMYMYMYMYMHMCRTFVQLLFGDVQAASTAERLGVLQAACLDGEADFLAATHFAQITSSLFVTPQTCNRRRPLSSKIDEWRRDARWMSQRRC